MRIGEPSLAPPTDLEDCPDRATLELALATPRPHFFGHDPYPTLHEKAAVLLYSLAKSQACVDGNKRVALILVRTFLHINGAGLDADDDTIAGSILRAAHSQANRETRDRLIIELAEWLAQAIVTTTEEDQ
ncbi:MAG: type II toxin-antitoxin system death-on-curing family toxin [Gaiellaceae bacterium]